MSSWVLVLSMWSYGSSYGVAIHSVPGFATQHSCMSAAAAWIKIQDMPRARAVCVEQKK